MRAATGWLLGSVCSIAVFSLGVSSVTNVFSELGSLLNDTQKEVMEQAIAERARIALEGLLLGLCLALAVVWMPLVHPCLLSSCILFVVQGAYYSGSVATRCGVWILNHLETREQVDEWLQIYRKIRVHGIGLSAVCSVVFFAVCSFVSGLRLPSE